MHLFVSFLMVTVLRVASQQQPYSPEQEKLLGQQLAGQMRQQTTPINSPKIQEYVDRVGQKIGSHIQGAHFDYTFNVMVDDTNPTTHEPIALPGGMIFIPATLFVAAKDEAEFAGMLTHAMEHVALRHAVRQATANETVGGNAPLIFVGGWISGFDGRDVALAGLSQLRINHLEADTLAVDAMTHAAFDPAAMVRYIERDRSSAFPGATAKIFSSVPEREQRIAALNAAIARFPPTTYPQPGVDFAAVREEVVRLTPATEPLRPIHKPDSFQGDRPTLKRKK